ncbi:hypothetical protein JAAARDRAFT_150350 [Jaapia argillacea MUCL 33604]|uniref:Transcriptional regulator of RNA polII, SAGA, subunit-domain-containing protein n=1 Tax=Jaapia argillacea MUCL 33604 TaxID=933084 RepID=A0A067Q3C2_9AGAM|nr:hypothetical protein JAAARDRAFT_150350 [Jaapia argillacea MUCL 33604]
MSLSSTSTIKNQLTAGLGSKASKYWETLQSYIQGQIPRVEFDESVRELLDSTNLLQLHNALIISLFDTTAHQAPPTPPPDLPKAPPRKRRRTLPYQGPESDDTLRSSRLKRWALGVGRRERDRVRGLETLALSSENKPRKERDEIARERGVILLPERGDPAGSRLPLHLASVTRAPTLQHISDRINLISAQHNLGAPSRAVSQLMMLAFEAKLKQLIIQAITLTSTSANISSISLSLAPSLTHPRPHSSTVLTSSTFDTLFTLSPAVLPNKSAAAMRLALGDNESSYFDEEVLKEREVRDQRWQMFALLGERSTVKEALRTMR